MVAIIGLAGESRHRAIWFHPSQKKQALQWLSAGFDREMERSGQPPMTRLLSDREAMTHRWRDGRRIYDVRDMWTLDQERAMAALEGQA